jgi:hypothetical protein
MKSVSRLSCRATALAVAAMLAAGCSKGDRNKAAENVAEQNSSASAAAISNSRADRSTSAINILVAAAQARDAIRRQDKAGALTHVNAALAALDRIKDVPLVPIYTELSQQSFIGPIEAAKKEAGASPSPAQGASSAGTTAVSNTAATSNSSAPPLAVEAVTSGYSRVLLDTSATATQLNAAKSAIDRGDLKAADNSLRLLEQSVVLDTAVVRMPLVRARENLALASAAARRNDWAAAKAQLTTAAKSLGEYAQVAPATDLADVKVLQQQIAAYAAGIDAQHSDAAARIDGWWNRVADLTDKQG